jgi:hypothetical protein
MKRILFTLVLTFSVLLLTSNCFAQLVWQEWVARYPGPGNDLDGPFLKVDKYGNSYIAGTHRATLDDTIFMLVVKYNSAGVQQWATLYKYQGECPAPAGLALDTFGDAYVTALSGLNCYPPFKIITVKFSGSTGSVLWTRTYITQDPWNVPRDIKIDRLNGIYVVGTSDTSHLVIKYNIEGDEQWIRKWKPDGGTFPVAWAEACTIDDSLNVITTGYMARCSPGCDSLLVIKYSRGGILRWLRTYRYYTTFPSYIEGTNITADQYGNIYVGGRTRPGSDQFYLTLKYDRNGVFQWGSIYDAPGNGDNTLRGIAMDRTHNALLVTGWAVANGVAVAATIKYNSSTGDSIWVRNDTGIYRRASASDIVLDSLGNSYITGSTHNIPQGSAPDILTIKYSQQGIKQWMITYNGPFNGWDGGVAIGIENATNIYVLGGSQSNSQVSDYVVIKYSQLLGIESARNEIPRSFALGQNYPNPFNEFTIINYQLSISSNVTIKVYDVLGRAVKELVNEKQRAGNYTVRFNASELSSGLYLYRLIANDNTIDTKKLIIAK